MLRATCGMISVLTDDIRLDGKYPSTVLGERRKLRAARGSGINARTTRDGPCAHGKGCGARAQNAVPEFLTGDA